jgi:hypothetical protein
VAPTSLAISAKPIPAHLAGEEALDEFLRSLDTALDLLIRESDGELEIDICSDHGNLFSNYRQVRSTRRSSATDSLLKRACQEFAESFCRDME